VSIIMTGVAEFRAAVDALVARTNAATLQAATTGAHLVEAQIKETLTESHRASNSGGRDSRGRFTKGEHSASPPGAPPALVTGTLRRSVRVVGPVPKGATGWTVSIGPTAVYGRIQELGGTTGAHGSQLPARPYVAPSLKKVIDDGSLANCFTTAWRTAF
jgi:phage gpG-like protein